MAFETLKSCLTSALLLAHPDFTQLFNLTCNASNYAISAILSKGPVGKDRPTANASRTLTRAESNYSVTEKECLGIIWGTKTFRPYLYGNRFTILTDHKPLKWLFNCKDPGSKLVRWRLKLEEFDYVIEYKKGKINSNANALSRFAVNPIVQDPNDVNPNENSESTPAGVDGDNATLPFSPLTLNDLELPATSDSDNINLLSIDLLEPDNLLPNTYSPENKDHLPPEDPLNLSPSQAPLNQKDLPACSPPSATISDEAHLSSI